MSKRVEEFVYTLLVDVFHAGDTADIAKSIILEKGSYDIGSKAGRIEDPTNWTKEMIIERAKTLVVNSGPDGDFDD